jgi:sn-glycerol 3-phosphate transport system substrate-binding protein
MWHHLDENRVLPMFETIVADFESAHPDITIELESTGGADRAMRALPAVADGDEPNVVQLWDSLTAPAVTSELFVPLNGCGFDAESLLPAPRASYTIDGELWASPFLVSAPVLIYDRYAFTAAGLDPDEPPGTLDELVADAHQIVDTGAASTGLVLETGVNGGGSWYVEQTLAQLDEPSFDADNGRTGTARSVHWTTPDTNAVLTTLRSMIEDGSAVYIDNQSGFDDLFRLIDPEQPAAMTLHTSGSLGDVLDGMASTPDRVGVAPFPAMSPSGRAGGIPGGTSLWLPAGQTPREEQAARLWVQYLTSPSVQAAVSAATGYLPVRAAALQEPALTERAATWPQLLVGPRAMVEAPSDPANVFPLSPGWGDARTLLAQAVHAVIVDGADPASALRSAEVAANALLAG